MYVSILMTFGCQNVMYLNLSDPFASYATRMNIEYRILKRALPTLQHICERGFYFPHAACVIFVVSWTSDTLDTMYIQVHVDGFVWKKIILLLNFLFKRCPLKKGKINKKCYYFPFGLSIYVFKINLIALACLVHNYACFVYKIQYKRNIRGLKK